MNILLCNFRHGLNLIFVIFYNILSKITQTKYQNLKYTIYHIPKIKIKNKKVNFFGINFQRVVNGDILNLGSR